MMLATALSTLLEQALNTWLRLDASSHGNAAQQLQALQGQLLCIQLTQPELHLYLLPTSDYVRVMPSYDAEPDVVLQGSALAFMRMANANDSGKAMLENGIRIDGSMGLAEQFSQILSTADIDWEELLARVLGDPAAHQIGQLGRSSQTWLQDSRQALQLNIQEYLQEERQLLPTELTLQPYLNAVDSLRLDAERLQARVQRLQIQLDALTTQQSD